MMRVLALLTALLAPVPALALSCLAPTVERSYAQHDAAAESYVVVHGRLTLDVSDLPDGMAAAERPPRMTRVAGHVQGVSLNLDGFELPFEQDVTLEVVCLSRWCGSTQNGADVLAFLRKDAEGYALTLHPCGGSVFGEPKPVMLKQVAQCMATGDCTEG